VWGRNLGPLAKGSVITSRVVFGTPNGREEKYTKFGISWKMPTMQVFVY
jgi:hypothetical protein